MEKILKEKKKYDNIILREGKNKKEVKNEEDKRENS